MARSDEAENFFAATYQAVQEIPYGRVTSYGHIARLIGRRRSWTTSFYSFTTDLAGVPLTAECPRQVGVCLKHLPSADEEPSRAFHSDTVPWQRVINSKGIISPRGHPSGAAHQAAVLRQEGVEVETGNMGELMVDLGTYGWFPEVLPSEAE